jgi:hypothetical protein
LKIRKEDLYQGAALTQIAEHERFTAINAVRVDNRPHRSAFKVNDNHCIFLKYATEPKGTYDEYVFTFNRAHRNDLQDLATKSDTVFIGLVCIKDQEICLLSLDDFQELIERRR